MVFDQGKSEYVRNDSAFFNQARSLFPEVFRYKDWLERSVSHAFLCMITDYLELIMTSRCLTFEKIFFNSLEFNVNLTHFMPLVSFYTLKIIRKREVVDIFKGFRKRPVPWKSSIRPCWIVLWRVDYGQC